MRTAIPPIRYEAVKKALQQVANFALENNAKVQMPRIGCGLAGGTWDKIEAIINETLLEKKYRSICLRLIIFTIHFSLNR